MNALILVDLQNDFMPGGALAVDGGNEVVAVANRLLPHFDINIATQDWHPWDHMSFASQHDGMTIGDVVKLADQEQNLWPDHCVQGTSGADLHKDLEIQKVSHVVRKGTNREIDSYSAFFDNDRQRATGLSRLLKEQRVSKIAVMGLATDYCVKFTARDAIALGLDTTLIVDGCRGVELHPGDVDRALAELNAAGVRITSAEQWIEKQTLAG